MKNAIRLAGFLLLAFSLNAAAAAPGAWVLHDGVKLRGYNASNLSFTADTLKVALFTSSSNCTTTSVSNYASLTNQVGTSNTGYTTGGITATFTWSGNSTVTLAMTSAPVWTAGTSNLTARCAAIYDDSDTNKTVIAHLLLDATPADVTTTSTNTLTINTQTIGTFN